jgi:hypothetical protein
MILAGELTGSAVTTGAELTPETSSVSIYVKQYKTPNSVPKMNQSLS